MMPAHESSIDVFCVKEKVKNKLYLFGTDNILLCVLFIFFFYSRIIYRSLAHLATSAWKILNGILYRDSKSLCFLVYIFSMYVRA